MQFPLRNMVFTIAATLAAAAAAASEPFLYAADAVSGTLYTINKANGATVASVPVTIGGNPVASIKGLAARESTGELFAVVRTGAPAEQADDFALATIAPNTGVATVIGPLSDRFAGLAWAALPPTDGVPWTEVLLGVTGDGANVPETLYTINPNDASATFFMTLGNGGPGETIAYNPDDTMLYHLSGSGGPEQIEGVEPVFEKIDLMSMAITGIPLSGAPLYLGNGLAYDGVNTVFYVSVASPNEGGDGLIGAEFFSLDAGGVATPLGFSEAFFGGMAFSYLVPVELQSFSIE